MDAHAFSSFVVCHDLQPSPGTTTTPKRRPVPVPQLRPRVTPKRHRKSARRCTRTSAAPSVMVPQQARPPVNAMTGARETAVITPGQSGYLGHSRQDLLVLTDVCVSGPQSPAVAQSPAVMSVDKKQQARKRDKAVASHPRVDQLVAEAAVEEDTKSWFAWFTG